MKRFRFSLAALKTQRERREQEALEVYAGAVRTEQRVQAELEALTRNLESEWDSGRRLLVAGVPANEFVQLQNYCQAIERRRREKENELALARQALRQKLHLFMAAKQKREVVDKFLEKQRRRHALDCQREEQKMLDELASQHKESGAAASLTMNDLNQN
jgi:flagellar protein FliJ